MNEIHVGSQFGVGMWCPGPGRIIKKRDKVISGSKFPDKTNDEYNYSVLILWFIYCNRLCFQTSLHKITFLEETHQTSVPFLSYSQLLIIFALFPRYLKVRIIMLV